MVQKSSSNSPQKGPFKDVLKPLLWPKSVNTQGVSKTTSKESSKLLQTSSKLLVNLFSFHSYTSIRTSVDVFKTQWAKVVQKTSLKSPTDILKTACKPLFTLAEYLSRVFKTPTDVFKTACKPLQFSLLCWHLDFCRRLQTSWKPFQCQY